MTRMQRSYIVSTINAMGGVSSSIVPYYAEVFLERPATVEELRELGCSDDSIARYLENVKQRNGADSEKPA